MPGEDIYSWSVTAANNGNSDSAIEWREGQTRASVNNSSRSEMAAHAKDRNLKNGSISTTNSGNAYAFTSGIGYTTVPTGLRVKLKIGTTTNTNSATLNMDGIGDVTIKNDQGVTLLGGELVANAYTDFLYDGTNWIFLYSRAYFYELMTGGGGIIIGTQTFATVGSFTYTPTPGMECCIIECIGGGGAGGGTMGDVNSFATGGGGGSGGYSRKTADVTTVGVSQPIIVGAGGVGALAIAGSGGGTTSVGSLCVAYGGSGGPAYPQGGGGATPGIGDVAAGGASGHAGASSGNQSVAVVGGWGGSGGAGPFGGGGNPGQANSGQAYHGFSATAYGSGGGGGNSNSVGVSTQGGNGSSGLVIITEFCGKGAPGRDGATGPVGPAGPAGSGTGDVLVSGVPAAGQWARWTDTSHIQGLTVAPIQNVVVQTFTASGTYTPTTGMVYCIVECVGGGGGGGGAAATNTPLDYYMGGGGGGSGGYSRTRATAAEIGVSKIVTVGAAGTAGAYNAPSGGAGTPTSVGSLCAANGGSGGGAASYGFTDGPIGGAGATSGTGTVVANGSAGSPGMGLFIPGASGAGVATGGMGAGSHFGGGGQGVLAYQSGTNGGTGTKYGAGGGGGAAAYAGYSGSGGAGSAGIVIITEYL